MKKPKLSSAQDFITESAVQNSTANLLDSGSLLIVTRSGILAHSLPIAVNLVSVSLNQDIKALTPCPATDAKFLWYAFKAFEREILNTCRKGGTTVHSIEFPSLQAFEIPLPPLNEQKRIVAKIEELFSELDAGEASLRQAKQQLGVYRQSLLKQAFEGKLTQTWRTQNPDKLESPDHLLARIQSERQSRYEQQLREWEADLENWKQSDASEKKPAKPKKLAPTIQTNAEDLRKIPACWQWMRLAEASEVAGGLTKNSKRDTLPKRIPYLRVANVYANELRLDEIKDIGVTPAEAKKTRLEKGDLLIVEGNGSLDQIGRVAAWDGSIDNCGHQNHLIRARSYPSVTPSFVLSFLISPQGRSLIEKQAASTSGLHTLSVSKVGGLPVPLCSLAEQREIVRLLDEQFEVIAQNEREIDAALRRSEALRQSILKKAFTGQLVPQDPTDEPASQLLARIQAQRAEIPAESVKKRKTIRKAKV